MLVEWMRSSSSVRSLTRSYDSNASFFRRSTLRCNFCDVEYRFE